MSAAEKDPRWIAFAEDLERIAAHAWIHEDLRALLEQLAISARKAAAVPR